MLFCSTGKRQEAIGKRHFLLIILYFLSPIAYCLLPIIVFALSDEEIITLQAELKNKPVGERIAFWAEKFIGVPYDKDPMGEYVSKSVIVADERVDCMYLTFRAVELALSGTPDEAVDIALNKRFHSKGIIKNGRVINYDNRFEYGEDMIYSGKWGKDITSGIGMTVKIKGSRGKDRVDMLKRGEMIKGMRHLKNGDIVFFIKDQKKRTSEEIAGHMGIIKIENKKQKTERRMQKEFYLIHASGVKEKGGIVKKVLLKDYVRQMPFIGAKITRFHEPL